MSTSEVAIRPQQQDQAVTLPAKVRYAHELATSGLLPAAYRRQPANILYAIEYGEMLGLSSMAAITGVHVIDGKPTASAGLISALVRRAGHKLRVRGNGKTATCQIIRADDPGHVFEVTWTLKRNTDDNPSAEEAGLLGKDVWKKYPASMLKSRAITQCARDACEEALFGLHYTPEELGAEVDEEGVPQQDAEPRGRGTVFIDPECLVEDDQSRLAERSGGTPGDDPWYVRPEPGGEPQAGRSWADRALAAAGTFTTEAAGAALYREAAAKVLSGECTPGQASHIQNRITARIAARRKEAAARILTETDEDDPWRDKILNDLADDEEARGAISELEELSATGQLDADRARLLARAVIARFPRAALGETPATQTAEAGGGARSQRGGDQAPPPAEERDAYPAPETAGDAPPRDAQHLPPPPGKNEPGSISDDQLTKLHTALTGLGLGSQDRDKKLVIAEIITGHDPLHGPFPGRSTRNLSLSEARKLIDTLDGYGGDRDKFMADMAEREQGTP